MLDKAIVVIFCIILILTVSLVSFEMVFTIVQKTSFDNACRNALLEIDMKGGLENDTRETLAAKLADCGFWNILIEAPSNISYGNIITLTVTAKHSVTFSDLLGILMNERVFGYENSVISRKVHNGAF